MGASNPQSLPLSERQQLAKVQADILALVARIDGARWPIRELDVATKTLARLRKEEALLQSRVLKEPKEAMSPTELAALRLLVQAAFLLASPKGAMMIAVAENGDWHTRHKGTSERWMMHLRAALAIKAGALSDPAIRASTRSSRAPTSVAAWINAGSWAGAR
jgi:hypothetical protein